MFEQKASLQRSSVELSVSYMEIYKDEVYDLLVNRETVSHFPLSQYHRIAITYSFQAPKLPVRENDAGQVFVANLTSFPIQSMEEFDRIYSCVRLADPFPLFKHFST